MTCDSGRPCKRCIAKGLEATCVDAPRKVKKYLLLDENNSDNSKKSVSDSIPASANIRIDTQGPTIVDNADHSQPKVNQNSIFFPQNQPYDESMRFSNNTNNFDHSQNNLKHQSPILHHQNLAQQNSIQAKKLRAKFLSNAINNEYSILSDIINQDDVNISSPSYQGTASPPNNLLNNFKSFRHGSGSNTSTPTPSSFSNPNTDIYNSYKEGDKSINQYTLGYIQDQLVTFPQLIESIEGEKMINPEYYNETVGDKTLSFSIRFNDSQGTSSLSPCGLKYKEPEDIYAKIRGPFSYTPGFHALNQYLRSRFNKQDLIKMAKSMASYRPSFIACTNTLKEDDLIFMEQCFQRTLLEYDKFISLSGTPTIVWRRTGQIAYVSEEFCILTGWTKDQLLNKLTFIVELMDNVSVIEYFNLFSTIAYGDFRGATMTGCTLLTPENSTVKTTCMWTLKRDVFGIPMMIIGNFLPIL
ncbi:hypothetical protein WICMUC_004867 [Wickerhamomyces mucosus]|uniref:ERT1/acuK family PAS domain-containing protein n=1 Tax=Wickerhamomyces mucosus TaxID=1378264 RepID=A0A9P8PDK7_9ASCO|nr:hypothetical protein WICMUC_004867 [Wickerhamomyces mucosus]